MINLPSSSSKLAGGGNAGFAFGGRPGLFRRMSSEVADGGAVTLALGGRPRRFPSFGSIRDEASEDLLFERVSAAGEPSRCSGVKVDVRSLVSVITGSKEGVGASSSET